jgi:hypothetical protein
MTHNAEKLSQDISEPLDDVLGRGLRGESITAGMGPFFITFYWPGAGRTRIFPAPFDTVEAALLYLSLRLLDDPDAVEPGSYVTICFRLGSTLVH